MANQVAARLSGDDYQHLYAWQFVLELLNAEEKSATRYRRRCFGRLDG